MVDVEFATERGLPVVRVVQAPEPVDNVWTGAVDTNYNNPANWSLGRVPAKVNGQPAPNDFDDAVLNTSTGNIPTITANFAAIPRDIIVGTGPNRAPILSPSDRIGAAPRR